MDETIELHADNVVTGADFGNDEIKEDNTCHYNNNKPCNPIYNILKLVQVLRLIEVEITQWNSQNAKPLSYEPW